MNKQKKQLSKAEASKTIPIMKELNKLSKAFIGILKQKVKAKKESVHTLSVMVNEISIPQDHKSLLSITTIDINDTRVSRKGQGSYSESFKWEKPQKKNPGGINNYI